jgi:hypothetical protein
MGIEKTEGPGNRPTSEERRMNMNIITVKEVKGYKIQKYENNQRHYFVNIREGKGFREFHTFTTIKAAVKFIEDCL